MYKVNHQNDKFVTLPWNSFHSLNLGTTDRISSSRWYYCCNTNVTAPLQLGTFKIGTKLSSVNGLLRYTLQQGVYKVRVALISKFTVSNLRLPVSVGLCLTNNLPKLYKGHKMARSYSTNRRLLGATSLRDLFWCLRDVQCCCFRKPAKYT